MAGKARERVRNRRGKCTVTNIKETEKSRGVNDPESWHTEDFFTRSVNCWKQSLPPSCALSLIPSPVTSWFFSFSDEHF